MKKIWSQLKQGLIIMVFLVVSSYSAIAVETNGLIPQIEILLPGITTNIEIYHQSKPAFSHFIILAIGYGPLSISLRNSQSEGEVFLTLTGAGISSAGIFPIFKFANGSDVIIHESIEIGNKSSPFGLVWLLIGADSPEDPPYSHVLSLAF